MKRCRLLVLACVVALGVPPVIAQDTVTLQIEITRDGSVVARPQLRGAPGRELRVDLDGQLAADNPLVTGLDERITITPNERGDDLALAFNIASGEKQLRPSLVISKDVPGSLEWTAADDQPIRLTIAWVQ